MYNKPIIGFDEAKGAIEAMVKEVRSNTERYWQHACMVIADNNGVPVCIAKLDKSSYQSYEQALRRARTSGLWGIDTSTFHGLVNKRDWSEQTYGPDYTVCHGGVAIVPPEYEGSKAGMPVCLGGIGVSGAGEFSIDDELARIGLEYIKSILWPSK
ncbi:heme-binding protein [Chloroflexota bacterium]